jgi:hypothetical protein
MNLQKRAWLIRCECGEEILLIPDLRAMSQAIEVHVLEHKKREADPIKAEESSNRVRNHLIIEVLKKASHTKDKSLLNEEV